MRPGRRMPDDRPDRDPALRAKYIKGRAGNSEREPDPNSPFAKLAKLKEQTQKDKKALADLDEEARRAGVPPGWLR